MMRIVLLSINDMRGSWIEVNTRSCAISSAIALAHGIKFGAEKDMLQVCRLSISYHTSDRST